MNQIQEIVPASATAELTAEEWAQRLQGTNINSSTLLATDYLNHFNEVIMLIEMLADMPDMLDEVLAWEPKSYRQHFADSGFKDSDLAIEAYNCAPDRIAAQFDALVACLDGHVLKSQERYPGLVADMPPEMLAEDISNTVDKLHRLVEMISNVINGSGGDAIQDYAAEAPPGGNSAQDEIDALF